MTREEFISNQDLQLEDFSNQRLVDLEKSLYLDQAEIQLELLSQLEEEQDRRKRQAAMVAILLLLHKRLRKTLSASLKTVTSQVTTLSISDFRKLYAFDDPKAEVPSTGELRSSLKKYPLINTQNMSVDAWARSVVSKIQNSLSISLLSSDKYKSAVKTAFSKTKGFLKKAMYRAKLVVRSQINRIYNHVQDLGVATVNRLFPRPEDPLMRQATEYIDHNNHPFSRALHLKVAKEDEPFRVSISEASRAARLLGASLGGMFWPQVGSFYVGNSYPAHFNERGRITPYRESWGLPKT